MSAVLPSICSGLKLTGYSLSASLRLPPLRSVAGFCGLMSLVVPSSACAAGRDPVMTGAQPDGKHAGRDERDDDGQRSGDPQRGSASALSRFGGGGSGLSGGDGGGGGADATVPARSARTGDVGRRLWDRVEQSAGVLVLRIARRLGRRRPARRCRPCTSPRRRWARCLTTERSCETNRYDNPNRSCRSSSRLMIPAWIDTSSADTGSSSARILGCNANALAMPMRCF